jgi:hypothetical protein
LRPRKVVLEPAKKNMNFSITPPNRPPYLSLHITPIEILFNVNQQLRYGVNVGFSGYTDNINAKSPTPQTHCYYSSPQQSTIPLSKESSLSTTPTHPSIHPSAINQSIIKDKKDAHHPHHHHAPDHRRLHPRLGSLESRPHNGRTSPRMHNKPIPNLAPNPRQGQRRFPQVVWWGRRVVVELQGK